VLDVLIINITILFYLVNVYEYFVINVQSFKILTQTNLRDLTIENIGVVV
jgi:hypothetical protein